MRFIFQIALILAASTCEANEREDMNDFMLFASENGKDYKSVEDFQQRKKIFKKNHNEVKRMNRRKARKTRKNAAKFADNFTSDWEDSEFLQMLGIDEVEMDSDARRLDDDTFEEEDLRYLQDTDTDTAIDWVAAGRMHPVKNQGGCGSCWAFAAGTAQEAMQAIKDDATPERLSEQQAVDCSKGSCRRGGWMTQAWGYWKNNGGAMTNADYKYTAKDQNCKTPADQDQGVSFVKSYGSLGKSTQKGNSLVALNRLSMGPLAVAVSAGNKCWQFYDSGILRPGEDCYKGGIDHAVNLVAYTPAATGEGEETCTTEETTICKKATRQERKNKQCNAENAVISPNKKGTKQNKRCCTTTEEEKCTQPEGSTPATWTIQNSWSKGWGDNGFMQLEVSEGDGTSGINRYMEWVTVE